MKLAINVHPALRLRVGETVRLVMKRHYGIVFETSEMLHFKTQILPGKEEVSNSFFFFLRRYNFREVLAFSTNSFHLGRFLMQSFQFVILIFVISLLRHPPIYF
jgi:hypothetical protein